MKAAANGAIQCTTPDGWAYELDWYGMGYALPIKDAETKIYDIFQKKIIPAYYRKSKYKFSEIWVQMMKETIIAVAPQYSSTRMVNDYVKQMYR
jgi:glycogen phosphorylase